MDTKREEFLRRNRVDLNVANFMNKENKERYTEPDKKIPKRRNTKGKRNYNRIKAVIAASVILFGGMGAYSEYKENQKQNIPVELQTALENGETLETLGIDESTYEDIRKFNLMDIENLSDEELKDMIKDSKNIQFEIVKDKLSEIYNVDESEISIIPEGAVLSDGEVSQEAAVKVGEEIVTTDISTEVKEMFQNCEDANINYRKVNDEDEYNKEDTIKALKDDKKTINQMAAKKITKTKDGRLEADIMTVGEIAEKQQEGMER